MPNSVGMRAITSVIVAAAAACGGEKLPPPGPLPAMMSVGGPEIVLLRFTRTGGFPRSYRWPALDVPAWTGETRLPAIDRVLAFDDVAGQVALVAAGGRAGRLDLRSGQFESSKVALAGVASADGSAFYGINGEGEVSRAAAGAEWHGPPANADSLMALPGGYIVLVSTTEKGTGLARMRPPAQAVSDTIDIPPAHELLRTIGGDRIYARTSRGVYAIDTRAWKLAPAPRASHEAISLAPTPSGDRVFMLDDRGRSIKVWFRYSNKTTVPIPLPVPATDLRMDPLGRYVLAKMELTDSAYVLSVPAMRIVRTVATEWRDDLPTLAPDGTVLALRREDVHAVDPLTGARRRRLRGAAADYWMFVRWDGFRPRDSSLDTPATFEMDPAVVDSAAEAEKIDSLLAARAEIVERERLDSIARATSARGRSSRDTVGLSYTLSFASLLSESAARALAGRIRVDGRPPRVVASTRDGLTIYRVVLGPYATREAAEAAGQRSGVPFWVFAGLP